MLRRDRKSCRPRWIADRELYSDLVREQKVFGAVCILILFWTVFRILSWKQYCATWWDIGFSIADGYVYMNFVVIMGEIPIPLALYCFTKVLDGESGQLTVRRKNRQGIFLVSLIKVVVFSALFAAVGTMGAGITGALAGCSVCNWDQADTLYEMIVGDVWNGALPGIGYVAVIFFLVTALTYFWWGALLCTLRNIFSRSLVSYEVCIAVLVLRIGLRDYIAVWGIHYSQWQSLDIWQPAKVIVSGAAIVGMGFVGIRRKDFF